MLDLVTYYAANLGVILAMMLLLWPISIRAGDPSFIDAVWPTGFIVLACSSALLSGQAEAASPVFAMVVIWGARLAIHLFLRWRREGMDRRYKVIMGRAKGNVHVFVLTYVFMMQGVLLWLVALPIQNAVGEGYHALGVLAWVGFALYALGLFFEVVGDWQLMKFKADPANEGQIMDRGLWRYTRHPNYFGDACLFWGIWLVAVDNGTGWWTAIGPAFLTFTLVKWSGAALLEKNLHKSRPGYADYVARTPGFIPWFPKPMPEAQNASE